MLPVHGEIDISRKQWIEAELGQIEGFGSQTVTILDLTGVHYLDTTFLNALLNVQKNLASAQTESSVCIVAPAGNPAPRLFKITMLDKVFQMFDDVLSAQQYAASL